MIRASVATLAWILLFGACGGGENGRDDSKPTTAADAKTVTATATATETVTSAPSGLTLVAACQRIGRALPRNGVMPGPSREWRMFQKAVAAVFDKTSPATAAVLEDFASTVARLGNAYMPSLHKLTGDMDAIADAIQALSHACKAA